MMWVFAGFFALLWLLAFAADVVVPWLSEQARLLREATR